jgi:MerR family transcriptional regulator, aldehyde-responsive regulator
MARRSGFAEPTLRYYEKAGLLGAVARDPETGYRVYDAATVARVDTLACLRSSGMSVDGLRHYVELVARGDEAAGELRELFTGQAARLAGEIELLRARQAYLDLKAQLYDARVRGDEEAERALTARGRQRFP